MSEKRKEGNYFRRELEHARADLDRVARALWPGQKEEFTYTADGIVSEIIRIREALAAAALDRNHMQKEVRRLLVANSERKKEGDGR